MRIKTTQCLAVAGAGLLACAHAAKPEAELATSEAAVETAKQMGAKNIPPAALELQLAEEELQHAQDLIKNDANEKAQWELMRAKADAELAVSLTKKGEALAAAGAAQNQLQQLQTPAPTP